MKTSILSIKGTRDFYPQEMAIRTWLYSNLRAVAESFGYQEYDGPFLESLELYAAKSGEELVKEQSYVFPDRGGDLITLRPELTPSLARMVAARQNQLTYPLRWWSFGPFWRYERPQKGRSREFFQWNVDLIGVDTPEADAELVAVVATLFSRVGLTPDKAIIQANSRKLVDAELAALAIAPESRPGILSFIDRRSKMSPEAWLAYGKDLGLVDSQLEGLQAMLSDQDLWRKSEELTRFFAAVRALGLEQYVRFDPSTVRGLAYYTGIVFEAFELEGDIKRSILGGGRYNNLLADVGGAPLPATGFAMGDVVITLLLEKLGLVPQALDRSPAQVMVTVFDEYSLTQSFALASELRQEGVKTACYPEPAKLRKQFQYADRMGMRVALVLGPDEISNQQVTLKDLQTGSQSTVSRGQIVTAVQELLASPPAS